MAPFLDVGAALGALWLCCCLPAYIAGRRQRWIVLPIAFALTFGVLALSVRR